MTDKYNKNKQNENTMYIVLKTSKFSFPKWFFMHQPWHVGSRFTDHDPSTALHLITIDTLLTNSSWANEKPYWQLMFTVVNTCVMLVDKIMFCVLGIGGQSAQISNEILLLIVINGQSAYNTFSNLVTRKQRAINTFSILVIGKQFV